MKTPWNHPRNDAYAYFLAYAPLSPKQVNRFRSLMARAYWYTRKTENPTRARLFLKTFLKHDPIPSKA